MVVVTGASRGLGRAVCGHLVSRGVSVLGLARQVEGLPFPAMECDVASHEQVRRIYQYLRSSGARLTGLVNTAGIASLNLALTTPPETVSRVISTNLMGTIYCCQVLAPLMIRQRAGTVVNFSTIAVPLGLAGESVYVASKAGVEGFSRSFAREVAAFGLTVNCIAPGPIATDLLKGVSPAQVQALVSQQIIQRQFTPQAVCELVDLLFDERSRSLTGQVLHVGGA